MMLAIINIVAAVWNKAFSPWPASWWPITADPGDPGPLGFRFSR